MVKIMLLPYSSADEQRKQKLFEELLQTASPQKRQKLQSKIDALEKWKRECAEVLEDYEKEALEEYEKAKKEDEDKWLEESGRLRQEVEDLRKKHNLSRTPDRNGVWVRSVRSCSVAHRKARWH